MNKIAFILIMTGMFFIKGYAQRTEVLTLGVFHFDFPNLDMQQISEEDQINVCLLYTSPSPRDTR